MLLNTFQTTKKVQKPLKKIKEFFMKKFVKIIVFAISMAIFTLCFCATAYADTLEISPFDIKDNVTVVAQKAEPDVNEKVSFSANENSVTIEFSNVGNYIIATKNAIPISIGNIDEYKPIAIKELTNRIKLTDLESGRYYSYYIFKGDKIYSAEFIKKISFITTPETVYDMALEASSNNVNLKWDKVKNISCYEIFRNDSLIATTTENSYKDTKLKSSTSYSYSIRCISKYKSKKKYSKKSKSFAVTTTECSALPNVSGKCKTWANYQAVTCKSTPQYKLLNSDECYTDPETGIRKVGDYYCIALGSYYGSKIGQKYIITLSSGKKFKAILCDQKSDRHTDENHQYAVKNQDIIEFYIDRAYKPAAVDGSYDVLPQFKGAVVSIEKIM